jgi:hypothetical protein
MNAGRVVQPFEHHCNRCVALGSIVGEYLVLLGETIFCDGLKSQTGRCFSDMLECDKPNLQFASGAYMKNIFGAILKIILVILIGATAVMTLLGAVGTVCLAFNGTFYPAFRWVVPLMPTFQMLVYIKVAVGCALVLVTYATARGDRWFYFGALIFLAAGLGAAAYQMYLSSTARHIPFLADAPTNIRFYLTTATLIAFLIVRLPGIWNKSGLAKPTGGPGSYSTPAGLAMFVCGLLIETAPLWAGDAHTVDGFNYVLTMQAPLLVDGLAMIIAGIALLAVGRHRIARQRAAVAFK